MVFIIMFDNHNNQSHLASSTWVVQVVLKRFYWLAVSKKFLSSLKKILLKLLVQKHFKRCKYLRGGWGQGFKVAIPDLKFQPLKLLQRTFSGKRHFHIWRKFTHHYNPYSEIVPYHSPSHRISDQVGKHWEMVNCSNCDCSKPVF